MAQKFQSIVTLTGQARIAAAVQGGGKTDIITMVVGDGNGAPTVPAASQTHLVNEVWRVKLNSLKVDAKNKSWLIAEAIAPASVGGFWMRELGLLASDGSLMAVCNMAETYKPTLEQGSGRTQTLRMVLSVTDTSAVTLLIDDSISLATEEYVNDRLAEHEQSRNHPDATLSERGFAILSSTISEDETRAATPKAVKAANDNANGRVPASRKVNGLALTSDITLGAASVGAYTKAETDTQVAVAKTAADNANANANSRVPSSRKVNGLALTSDIALGAASVGAYTKAETETRVATAKAAADNANTNANGRVPLARKVNGKELSADINISASDVKALAVTTVRAQLDPSAGNVGDANELPANATSFVYSNTPNAPSFTGSLLDFSGLGNGYNVQLVGGYSSAGERMGFRTRNGDKKTWNPWYELYHNGREVQATIPNNYRIAYGDYGVFWRNDGVRHYLMVTNKNDIYGGYNALRPFYVDIATGNVALQHNVSVGGPLSCNSTITPGNYSNFDARYQLKNTASLSTAGGWQQDSSTGLIIQMGTVSRTGYSTAVNFPKAFPNFCMGVLLTLSDAGTGRLDDSLSNIRSLSHSKTGFTYGSNGDPEKKAFWVAFGK
ncbi:phage tail protein [Erwinia aphidicola]|uniref:phage tail protein n=1 Tax=Erwinia aphidicola TaxID=68334 RepID=UPI0030CB45DC